MPVFYVHQYGISMDYTFFHVVTRCFDFKALFKTYLNLYSKNHRKFAIFGIFNWNSPVLCNNIWDDSEEVR